MPVCSRAIGTEPKQNDPMGRRGGKLSAYANTMIRVARSLSECSLRVTAFWVTHNGRPVIPTGRHVDSTANQAAVAPLGPT
jgi:hypothetical protein